MKLFNWLFKKKEYKEIEKKKALKVYDEVIDLIEEYHNQMIKYRSYGQDVCNGLRDLYKLQLNNELEIYLKYPKIAPAFNNSDDVFNRVVGKVMNHALIALSELSEMSERK